ncbi:MULTISPECIES: CDP-glycerol glycerophosphotransferase family protein [unclassified Campylobacter]|uniref:CDP-glycerol glycerophosphotransferase family protein n=1 Tax=unclassified Campylobacter TaxID=2593542 RepID=UPI001D9265BD|nr:CDP-glycerol glycerophosphotransferase family protein [Campylobacter sp. RM9331]MBZ8005871.1 CDP-glycerol glycerophosphotransferase family protein [Campylobacter sp. RM9332]
MNKIFKKILHYLSDVNIFKRNKIIFTDMYFNNNVELIDNYSLFKYCVKNKYNAYYMLDKKHVQYHLIKKEFGFRIISYNSGISFLIFSYHLLKTKIWVDSANFLFISSLYSVLSKKNITYIQSQHGINYFKEGYRFHMSSSIYDKVILAGNAELNIFNKLYCYNKDNIIISGLPRWAGISNNKINKVLIYFTYREYLLIKNKYLTRYYFDVIESFLSSKELENLSKKGLMFDFAIHHELIELGIKIKIPSFVNLVYEEDIKKSKEEASLLITDFSSMCFDFYYLSKPVLFYHGFSDDPNLYLSNQDYELFLNLDEKYSILPNVFREKSELFNSLDKYFVNRFAFSEKENIARLRFISNNNEDIYCSIMQGILQEKKKNIFIIDKSLDFIEFKKEYTKFEGSVFKLSNFKKLSNSKLESCLSECSNIGFILPLVLDKFLLRMRLTPNKIKYLYNLQIFINDQLIVNNNICNSIDKVLFVDIVPTKMINIRIEFKTINKNDFIIKNSEQNFLLELIQVIPCEG